MVFCKIFDLEEGSLLVVKDPENVGLTFTTTIGNKFRSAATTFKQPSDTTSAFDEINDDLAAEILHNMLTSKNIHGEVKEDEW